MEGVYHFAWPVGRSRFGLGLNRIGADQGRCRVEVGSDARGAR